MNNKKLGNSFEKEFCNILSNNGFWVHFIEPNKSGAQPFDIIACKNNQPYVFDCKTNKGLRFSLSRIEDNQELAFEKYIKNGNSKCYFIIKNTEDEEIYMYNAITLITLKREGLASIILKRRLWEYGGNFCRQ